MTKLPSLLAAAVLAAAATATVAQPLVMTPTVAASARMDRFGADLADNSETSVRLGRIVADAAGVVEVYDYDDGRQGALVATEAFRAGNNLDVRVPLDTPRRNALLAVLTIDGQAVDQEVIRWNPDWN